MHPVDTGTPKGKDLNPARGETGQGQSHGPSSPPSPPSQKSQSFGLVAGGCIGTFQLAWLGASPGDSGTVSACSFQGPTHWQEEGASNGTQRHGVHPTACCSKARPTFVEGIPRPQFVVASHV